VIKNVMLRGQMKLGLADQVAETSDRCRVVVYLDKQCNGATAGVTDILESGDVDSFNNLANRSRFTILMDKVMGFDLQGGVATGAAYSFGQRVKPFQWFKTCNIPIEFDNSATTGAITTIRSNNIGVLAVTDAGLAETGYVCRIRYTDN